jgi:hypothetical protein
MGWGNHLQCIGHPQCVWLLLTSLKLKDQKFSSQENESELCRDFNMTPCLFMDSDTTKWYIRPLMQAQRAECVSAVSLSRWPPRTVEGPIFC